MTTAVRSQSEGGGGGELEEEEGLDDAAADDDDFDRDNGTGIGFIRHCAALFCPRLLLRAAGKFGCDAAKTRAIEIGTEIKKRRRREMWNRRESN